MISWPTLKVNWGFQLMLDMWLWSFRDGKKWTVENEQNDIVEKKYKKKLEKFFELFLIKNTTANDGSYQV